MWSQSLFSKKNRNLSGIGQRMDGYHSITSLNEIDPDLRRISHKIQKSLAKEGLFIERTPHGLMVGRCDMIGNLIGMEHEFAREFDFGGTSGERRAIRFGHAYHANSSKGLSIPDYPELLSKQKLDILHLLSEAHAGREPVSMQLTDFTAARQSGTDWDRIASEVEAGKCKGGIFSTEGKLLERFEDISHPATQPATQASASTAEQATSWGKKIKSHLSTPTGKGVAIAGGAALVIGGVMLARHFMHKHEAQPASAQAGSAR